MLFLPYEEGQGLVEYALILVLVAIVVIVILAAFLFDWRTALKSVGWRTPRVSWQSPQVLGAFLPS